MEHWSTVPPTCQLETEHIRILRRLELLERFERLEPYFCANIREKTFRALPSVIL